VEEKAREVFFGEPTEASPLAKVSFTKPIGGEAVRIFHKNRLALWTLDDLAPGKTREYAQKELGPLDSLKELAGRCRRPSCWQK